MWNCTHFRHPTDEQLGHVDIFFSNYFYLQSVYFELLCTVFTHSFFSHCVHSFDFWYANNSWVNTVRAQFPGRILCKVYCFYYLTNGFHVAVCLFSNRSQIISKCGKNKVSTDVCTTFKRLLWPITEQTHSNATWNLFVLYNEERRKPVYTYLPRTTWLFEDLC